MRSTTSRLLAALTGVAASLTAQPSSSSGEARDRIELRHLHTGERLQISGHSLPSPHQLNRFFRSTRDARYTLMDPRLVLFAMGAARRFRSKRIDVVSAFRSDQVNARMKAAGHGVARDSRHIHGQALDLRLPGVPTMALCRYFLGRRIGGVGCYPKSRFVHIDVGPIRRWGARPRRK